MNTNPRGSSHTDFAVVFAGMDELRRQLTGTFSNEESGSSGTQSRWGGHGELTLIFFVLFVLIGLLYLCVKANSLGCHGGNHSTQTMFDAGNHTSDGRRGSTKARTQEFIEKMIVLKNVFWTKAVDEDGDEGEKPSPNGYHRRNKSTLWLVDHGTQTDDFNDSTVCPICLCDYKDGEQICWSKNEKCAHHFHASCGIAWLAKHNECPLCREEYLVLPEQNGDEENQMESVAEDEDGADAGAEPSSNADRNGPPSASHDEAH